MCYQRHLLLALPLVLVLACHPSIEGTEEVASVTVEPSRDLLAAHVETLTFMCRFLRILGRPQDAAPYKERLAEVVGPEEFAKIQL